MQWTYPGLWLVETRRLVEAYGEWRGQPLIRAAAMASLGPQRRTSVCGRTRSILTWGNHAVA